MCYKDGSHANTIFTLVFMCKDTEVKGKAAMDLQSEADVPFDKKSKPLKIFPAQLNC